MLTMNNRCDLPRRNATGEPAAPGVPRQHTPRARRPLYRRCLRLGRTPRGPSGTMCAIRAGVDVSEPHTDLLGTPIDRSTETIAMDVCDSVVVAQRVGHRLL